MFNVCRDRAAKVPLSGNAARLHGPLRMMKGTARYVQAAGKSTAK
jgi:hypothetical protein